MARRALRDRQRELTRELILDALAGIVAEKGTAGFSMQDVAERAGTSHRTIYRHFPTREALLEALVARLAERVAEAGGMALPERADEIGPLVRHKFAVLDEFGPLVFALVRLDVAAQARSTYSARSTAAVRRALVPVVEELDSRTAEAVTAVIRHLYSSETWLALREGAGIDGRRSGEAVAWAVETLLEALRERRGPTTAGASQEGGEE